MYNKTRGEEVSTTNLDRGKLTHFAIFLLKSKSGKVFVFSQEDYGGKYKININKGMPGIYGKNVKYYKKK